MSARLRRPQGPISKRATNAADHALLAGLACHIRASRMVELELRRLTARAGGNLFNHFNGLPEPILTPFWRGLRSAPYYPG